MCILCVAGLFLLVPDLLQFTWVGEFVRRNGVHKVLYLVGVWAMKPELRAVKGLNVKLFGHDPKVDVVENVRLDKHRTVVELLQSLARKNLGKKGRFQCLSKWVGSIHKGLDRIRLFDACFTYICSCSDIGWVLVVRILVHGYRPLSKPMSLWPGGRVDKSSIEKGVLGQIEFNHLLQLTALTLIKGLEETLVGLTHYR